MDFGDSLPKADFHARKTSNLIKAADKTPVTAKNALSSRKMHIAIVGGFPPDPFGEAHYTGMVVDQLARHFPHAQIKVLAHRGSDNAGNGSGSTNLTVKRVTVPGNSWKKHFNVFVLLVFLLRELPDVVHFQGTHTRLYGGLFGEPLIFLYLLLRIVGIPVVLTIHSTWLPADLMTLWRQKNLSVGTAKLLTAYYQAYIRLAAALVSRVNILTSGDEFKIVDEYIENYKLPRRKICFELHPCTTQQIDSETIEVRNKLNVHKDAQIVLSCGFVRPDKGYHVLLEAGNIFLKEIDEAVLVIAGETRGEHGNAYAEQLTSMVRASPVGAQTRLHFAFLSDADFRNLFFEAAVVVIPYLRVLGASGPVHHALGFGKPVIAVALGHNLGLARVCHLVPPNDPQALAKAVSNLLKDEVAREEVCRKSKAYASAHTWEGLAVDYFTLYQQLAGGR